MAGGNEVKSECGKFTVSEQNRDYFKHNFAIDFLNDVKDKKMFFSSLD